MHSHKILNIAAANKPLQETLSKELGISAIIAQLLVNRGITTAAEAGLFLNSNLSGLRDPFDFRDMRKALGLLAQARQRGDKVMVYGDYDADGITSLALLKSTLTRKGFNLVHYLPHRVKEGYGLTENIHEVACAQGVKLLITADCGISNHAQLERLNACGITTVITDHHEPGERALPAAAAIINPKVKNSGYGFRELAGVGVVYKLCQALTGENLSGDLDLVALGTIADSVPLVDENRIIAREGLACLSRTSRPGLKALLELSGVKRRKFDTTLVSFILAPRLNASGRMDTAESSLALLLSENEEDAQRLAQELERYNRQRQKIESRILTEAEDIINREINFKEHKVIVIAKENWHHGVLGIVASKLADRFYRPAVVISLEEELCKGSARSIKNFHLFDALCGCRELLDEFGGHSHAAGLVITRDSIKEFSTMLNRIAHDALTLQDLLPSLDIDMELSLDNVDESLVMGVEQLSPYGPGNPEPLFYTRGLALKSDPRILSRDTIKFWAADGKRSHQVIGFGMSSFKSSLMEAHSFDMVYTPRLDTWAGVTSMILEAKDIFFR